MLKYPAAPNPVLLLNHVHQIAAVAGQQLRDFICATHDEKLGTVVEINAQGLVT